jgi:hypothetical protein
MTQTAKAEAPKGKALKFEELLFWLDLLNAVRAGRRRRIYIYLTEEGAAVEL